MVDRLSIVDAAHELSQAYRTRIPIAPLTERHPDLSVAEAYAVQTEQLALWEGEGRRILGYKIGLTSAAMQRQLGVDEPDYGYLLDTMVHRSGAALDRGALIAPRVEPEIAFVLKADLTGPGVTPDEARRAIGHAVGSLEVIDSRIADWRIRLADTIADNASSAAVVVGDSTAPLDEIDIDSLRVELTKNGAPAGSGIGADVLGSPINAVVWLANTLGGYGVTLTAGSLVLPGSVCAAAPVEAGDVVRADFGPLGAVEVRFESVPEGGSR